MTTQASPTAATTPPVPSGAVPSGGEPARGPVGRIAAASMVTSAVGAALSTFVLFPSASEGRVVGAALVAFAAGWALLGWLTTRFTTRPLRWAFVPAVALAALGVVTTLLDPQEPTLTRVAWVWAPVLVALAVFVVLRARHDVPGRVRLLVLPVAFLMGLAGVGGALQVAGGDARAAAGPMPGRLVDVGGYRLHLHCAGTGSPTVVLLNGLGETSPDWARIRPAVASGTRVCAYDRAGQGWSEDSPNPADATTAATDLHELLAAAGETGPYVLAGHSSGGVHALAYTHLYPAQVAGVVLLDSASPDQAEVVESFPAEYQVMRRALAAAPTLFRLGIGHLTRSLFTPVLPGDAGRQEAAFANSPRGWAGMRAEQAALPTAFAQAQALTTLEDVPLVVLTAKDTTDSKPGWGVAQDRLAALSTGSRHSVVDVDHVGLLHDPDGAAESLAAITDVVTAARAHTAPVR